MSHLSSITRRNQADSNFTLICVDSRARYIGKKPPGPNPYEAHKFNQAASDEAAIGRTIPDTRHQQCVALMTSYETAELPETSVIVAFHNEARSALLRTVRHR